MRRIRHVVLPVRSWHYIGLLIVSLACLTLGLVSRDREGHAGSLAGPELIHRAPHEADSCPNLNPFTKMPSTSVPDETLKSLVDEIKVSESGVSPASRRTVFSRSTSLDRSSRLGSRETRQSSGNRDLPRTERISRSRVSVNNEPANRLREFRSGMIARSRDVRSSYDPAVRLSRSRDVSNRATDRRSVENRSLNSERRSADLVAPRLDNRRLQSAERRELSEIAQNRMDRSTNRRVSPNLQRRADNPHDRRSLSTERRILSDTNRQESRAGSADRREYRDLARNRADRRSEMRDHRSRFIEQRAIERREAERSGRREDRRTLLNRSARISREDLNRNLGRQTRERSLENRRALRVANQERTSRSAAGDSRNLVSTDRRLLSRSMERMGVNDLGRETLRKQARSIDIERSSERRSSERRSLIRSTERREIRHTERREPESRRLADRRSLDRATSQVLPENLRRESVSRSRRISPDSRESIATRRNSRSALSRSRYDLEESANRERRARFSRSVDRNSVDQRSRSSRDSPAERRDLTLARREGTNRSYRRSRETERRISERVPERRVLERRVAADSARLDSRSERRIDDNSRSREGFRTEDRPSDSRVSRVRALKRQSARDSRRSTERRIEDESSRSRERSRMEDRRLERSLDSRLSRGRMLERSAPESQRSSERRINGSSRSREESRMANRRLERGSESRASRGRMSERRSAPESRGSKTDRRTDESSRLHKSRIQNRRLERNSELRDSIAMRRTERAVNPGEALLASRISRLSDKRSDVRNSREARAERYTEVRKIVPKAIEDHGLHEYPVTYDFLRQAFLVGLCTVYGLSLYGKKSFISNNIMQQAQRFLVW